MINVDGQLLTPLSSFTNRGFKFGDAVFETIKSVNANLLFWEDHYVRLMAAMRILRMEIPMNFTMEFLEAEILRTLDANQLKASPARIRLIVYRNSNGYYLPQAHTVSWVIEAEALDRSQYTVSKSDYTVELFRDHYVNPDVLSSLKTTNRLINIVGSIYAGENGYNNCLLLNQEKKVVEALNGNLFMVTGHHITTPPVQEGCINGIVRKQLIRILSKDPNYTLRETSISPFELQQADELFITNVIIGIQPVTRYRKKTYARTVAEELTETLNDLAFP